MQPIQESAPFEYLTAENAAEYLVRAGCLAHEVPVRELAWGVSNVVLWVERPGAPLVLKQSRPQLRTRDPWFSDPARVFREADAMRALRPVLGNATPEVLFEDRERFLFAMSAAPPTAEVWKQQLLAGRAEPGILRQAAQLLATMHEAGANRGGPTCNSGKGGSEARLGDPQPPTLSIPLKGGGDQTSDTRMLRARDADEGQRGDDWRTRFGDQTYFHQLRLEPYYLRQRDRAADLAGPIDRLVEETARIRSTLVHADFSPKNILVANGSITLVDYETVHFGDPGFDLGFFLTHLCLKAIYHAGAHEPFLGLIAEFWETYLSRVSFEPSDSLAGRGMRHLAAIVAARIDGTSPVEYLNDSSRRDAARALARRLFFTPPANWLGAVAILRTVIESL